MLQLYPTKLSENKIAASLVSVRAGISFAFIWAGYGKVTDPAGFGMMLQNMVGIESNISTAMAMFGFDFTARPGVWKDPALLCVVIGLAIYGSGKFGLDRIIANKIKSF